jgi:hypothetical protein
MIFPYIRNYQLNSNWKRVRLVIWGPSVRLLASDKEFQDNLEELKKLGIELKACKSDAKKYGILEDLLKLGIEIAEMKDPLTEYKHDAWAIVIL